MLSIVKSFLANEDGPTASEYAIMLALIVLVCAGALTLLGLKVSDIFSRLGSPLPDGG